MLQSSHRLYAPPRAIDLAGASATGGGISPMGICANGSNPISDWCASGLTPTQPAACAPTGFGPTYGGCNGGNSAVEGCSVGSLVDNCVTGGGVH